MKLGLWERFYVNGWIRSHGQRPLEFTLLQKGLKFPQQATVLDIGCGNGGTLAYVAKRFQPLNLAGLDFDPRQVALAQWKLKDVNCPVRLEVGSAEAMVFPDEFADVVTSFGCLHHVPDWRKALQECVRVMKPGAVFYGEEFYRPLLSSFPFRLIAPHPPHRFSRVEFEEVLSMAGIEIVHRWPRAGCSAGEIASLVVGRKRLSVS